MSISFEERLRLRKEAAGFLTIKAQHLAQDLGALGVRAPVTLRRWETRARRKYFGFGPLVDNSRIISEQHGWKLVQRSTVSGGYLEYTYSGHAIKQLGDSFHNGMLLTTDGEIKPYTRNGVMSPNLVIPDTRAEATASVGGGDWSILVHEEQIDPENGNWNDLWPGYHWMRESVPWRLDEPNPEVNGVYGNGILHGLGNLATAHGLTLR